MSERTVSYTTGTTAPAPTQLTPAECVAMGGHCWRDAWEVWFSGGQLPEGVARACRHCEVTQRSVRQESVKWGYEKP